MLFRLMSLDVLFRGVESVIGTLLLLYVILFFINNNEPITSLLCKCALFIFYAVISPVLSNSSCALIFLLHILCIFTQKKTSKAKMGRMR